MADGVNPAPGVIGNAALKEVVGGRTATALAKHLDLHTVDDLLHFYPRRYAERGPIDRAGSATRRR